jgi:hypothetical protein
MERSSSFSKNRVIIRTVMVTSVKKRKLATPVKAMEGEAILEFPILIKIIDSQLHIDMQIYIHIYVNMHI